MKKAATNDKYKWILLGFLWTAYFLEQGTRQIYNAILPQIQADFHVDSVKLGLVATTFIFTYGICVPVAGIASDLFSRKWMIVAGVAFFSTGIFVSGFASSIGLLLITYGLLNGTGQSFYYPSACSLIGQLHDKMRSTAISIHQTAQYFGIVVCSCVAGYLGELPDMGGVSGWQMPFLLFGGIGLLWAVLLAVFMRNTGHRPNQNGEVKKATFKEAATIIFHKPSAIALAFAFGFLVFTDVGFRTWMPTYLFETFRMDLGKAAFNAVIWHYAGAFIGVAIASRIADRAAVRGHKSARFDTSMTGFALGAPFIFLMVQSPSQALCIFAMAMFGFFHGVVDAGIFAAIFDVIPERYRASATGIILCVAFVIGSTSSTILGWIRDEFGLTSGIAFLSLFYFMSAVLFFIARTFFFHKDYEPC